MSKYIKLDDAVALSEKFHLFGKTGVVVSVGELKALPTADVVEVQAVIERMNEERKRAKGNWHTDPYWLGWVDAMRRAQRIVDGTIDDEPVENLPAEDVIPLGVELWSDRFEIKRRGWISEDGEHMAESFMIVRKEEDNEHE